MTQTTTQKRLKHLHGHISSFHILAGKSDHVLLLLQSQEGATPRTSPQRQRWGTGAHRRRWWRWWQSRQDGEVWKDRKDRGGFIWCGVQMSQQRDNAARRHQEICGVRGRPSHQEDCNAGNSHAEGKLSDYWFLFILFFHPTPFCISISLFLFTLCSPSHHVCVFPFSFSPHPSLCVSLSSLFLSLPPAVWSSFYCSTSV